MTDPKPLQIYKFENGKYYIDVMVINSILDKVGDRKLAIYSINGPLREGKSFMLNFFVKYLLILLNSGKDAINEPIPKEWVSDDSVSLRKFLWRGGSDRETTGMWMWSEPFILSKSDGTEIALLLMDTQGSFDDKTTMQENAFVFALSTLLSSFIIFNLKEKISEDKLQFLQYFSGYARLADEENRDEPFQKLLFLIRDWQWDDEYSYGYYDDTHSINGKNYKTEKLNPKEDAPKDVKYVHEMILSSYNHVSFYLMPHPGNDVARKSNFNIQTADRDFLQHLPEFVSLMLNPDSIVEKQIGGLNITGTQMKIFVDKWEKMFKADKLPAAKTLYQASAEIEYEIAKAAAVDNYTRKMREIIAANFGIDHYLLNDIHDQIFDECIDLFQSFRRLPTKDYDESYIEKITAEILIQFQYFTEMNHGNREIKYIKTEMENERAKFQMEIDESRAKLEQLKEDNSAERELVMSQLQSSMEQMDLMTLKNEKKMQKLKNQLESKNDQLNDLRRIQRNNDINPEANNSNGNSGITMDKVAQGVDMAFKALYIAKALSGRRY